jgi:hypothetical protein
MEKVNSYILPEQDEDKKFFDKVSYNLVGYMLNFLETNEILKSSKINKKFHKAMNSENLWEGLTLRDELFAQYEQRESSWKNYFLNMNKLKNNFKSGISNRSFKMKPMRGHPNFITSMCHFEIKKNSDLGINFTYSSVISGDRDGNVFYWLINEDEDYESVPLLKCSSQIINITHIKSDNLRQSSKYDELSLCNGLLVITEQDGHIIVYNYPTDIKAFNLINKINSDLKDIYQVEFHNQDILLCSNLHDYTICKTSYFIEQWNLISGDKVRIYQPTCKILYKHFRSLFNCQTNWRRRYKTKTNFYT